MSFSALSDLVTDLVPDTGARLTAGAMGRALEAARVQYSKDRPRLVLEDITAVAGNRQALPLGWLPGAALVSLEYPVGQFPPVMLGPAEFGLLSTPAGDEIGLLNAVPAGEVLRVGFTAPHVLTASPDTCTIPAGHFEAVACWAAALLCDQLAAAYADNTDPTIAVDRVDYTSPSRTWAGRAKAYRERYAQLVGVTGLAQGERATTAPACAEADLALAMRDGGSRYNRWRG